MSSVCKTCFITVLRGVSIAPRPKHLATCKVLGVPSTDRFAGRSACALDVSRASSPAQCFRIAAYCQDTSRFGGRCPCSPLRRAFPVCSRAEQTALGTQSGCAPRWRPRVRITARTGGPGRSFEAWSAMEPIACLSGAAASKQVAETRLERESGNTACVLRQWAAGHRPRARPRMPQ